MANKAGVMSSIKDFLIKMKALDEAIPEELAKDALEMTEAVKDALDEDPDVLEITKDEEPEEEKSTDKSCKDEDIEQKVEDALGRALMKYGLIKDKAMEALDQLEEEVKVEDEDNEESVTVDPEKIKDSARRELIRKVKPMVASIKDEKQRKKFADAFAEALNMKSNDDYGTMMKMAKTNAHDSMTSHSTVVTDSNFGMEIAKKFNPHYKEEN